MSTSPRKRNEPVAVLDMTSMIDVTFLLLIFFLCVTEMARADYEQLCLPLASQAVIDRLAPLNRQVINVVHRPAETEAPSQVLVRGRRYDRTADLVAHLRTVCRYSVARGETPVSVKIRADSRVPYVEVQKVMVACAKAGISRISIGATPERN